MYKRQVQTQLDGGVDVLDGGDALLVLMYGLQHEGEQAAVDDEARGVGLAEHGDLLHLGGDLADSLNGGVGGVVGADHLHQLHGVHRAEEMHAHAALGVLACLGDLGDGHGGGVGAEDGVGLADLAKLLEGILLQGQDLRNGLDDKVSVQKS